MSEDPGPGYGGGGGMRPVMDLSHLTAEERSIIEGVMQKQQMEENKEIRFLKVQTIRVIIDLYKYVQNVYVHVHRKNNWR